ncbi:MAG: D-alanyl-D-alanine carboxypeptidase [Lachnospiraceae bacterium]|nr:D-alanyl-D-alanine carboxypeptidase [Lachnospiraceae bacterium]
MEPIYDYTENSEKDREFYKEMERRRLRRLEKRKQEKRKKLIVSMLLSAGVIFIMIAIGIGVVNRRDTADTESREGFPEEAGIEASSPDSKPGEEEEESDTGSLVTESNDNEVTTEPDLEEPSTEQSTEGMNTSETSAQGEKKTYQFDSTPNTVNIYSEEVISTHSILVNVNDDTIVAANGTYDRISPASMTIVLTVLVAAEAIEKSDLDDTFTMTLEITDYAYINDCSYVGFLDGEVVTVRDLFYGTVLPSGGDAAVGLATYVAGSHEAFVDMMNAKLEELGLSDSAHFTNCVGLYDNNHYCTVYDMAVIMDAAMENELCREVLSAHIYTTTPTTQHPEGIEISNWFLRRIEDKDTGGLVVGAKTGYVTESGSCAVSYEEYADGTPYICVTAGATSSWRCIYDHVEIYNRYVPNGE